MSEKAFGPPEKLPGREGRKDRSPRDPAPKLGELALRGASAEARDVKLRKRGRAAVRGSRQRDASRDERSR